MIRQAAVSGMFYPGNKNGLEKQLSELIIQAEEKKKIIGLISPHAGYVYSGGCAGRGFGQIKLPDKVIVLGVNHRGLGHSFAVDGNGAWRTPLGDCEIDQTLRSELVKDSNIFEIDSEAGREEHSLEVQVPFIQYLNPVAKIVPITVSSMDEDLLLAAGKEIADCLGKNKDVLIVASTDMSHYVDADTAQVEDQKAINKILNLDPEGLLYTVVAEKISMCGVSPTVIMLSAAINMGAEKAEIAEYTHSGKVSGDYNQVVAYLSTLVY